VVVLKLFWGVVYVELDFYGLKVMCSVPSHCCIHLRLAGFITGQNDETLAVKVITGLLLHGPHLRLDGLSASAYTLKALEWR